MNKKEIAGPVEDRAAVLGLIKFLTVIANVSHKMKQDKSIAALAKRYAAEAEPIIKLWKANVAGFKKIAALTPKMDKFTNLTDEQWEYVDDYFTNLMKLLRQKAQTELHIPKEHIALLGNALRAVYNGSEPSFAYLIQRVGLLEDTELSRALAPKLSGGKGGAPKGYEELKKKIAAIVKKWSGKSSYAMPGDAKEKFRAANEKQYKEFLALNNELTKAYRVAIQSIIRSSGKPTMDVQAVREKLESMGIVHSLPKAFVGQMDDQTNFYTFDGKKLKQKPGGEVRMNPQWKDKPSMFYCEYQRPGYPTWNKCYTEEIIKERKQARFDAVQKTVAKLETFRRRWIADMKSGKEPVSTYGLLCEIAYLVSPRIGTEGNSTKKKGKEIDTYGLTTLRIEHTKVSGSKVILKYPGKAGEVQTHEITGSSGTTAVVVKKLKELIEGKGKKEQLFTIGLKPVRGDDVNGYMKKIGIPITYHGFRKVRGSFIMTTWLDSFDVSDPTPKEVNQYVMEGLKEVGKNLGHFNKGEVTGATALKSYVDPNILVAFFKQVGVRPAPAIEAACKEALEEME